MIGLKALKEMGIELKPLIFPESRFQEPVAVSSPTVSISSTFDAERIWEMYAGKSRKERAL
jgi:hypothetical protein